MWDLLYLMQHSILIKCAKRIIFCPCSAQVVLLMYFTICIDLITIAFKGFCILVVIMGKLAITWFITTLLIMINS